VIFLGVDTDAKVEKGRSDIDILLTIRPDIKGLSSAPRRSNTGRLIFELASSIFI
jgi:hypothetical protein